MLARWPASICDLPGGEPNNDAEEEDILVALIAQVSWQPSTGWIDRWMMDDGWIHEWKKDGWWIDAWLA